MTVTAAFCPLSLQTLLDANAKPIVGGRILAFAAETTTALTTYADAAMTVANPTPLLTDGFGRIPKIYIGAGAYKIEAQDASGALLFAVDDLPGGVDYVAQATAAAAAAGTGLSQPTTGDVKFKHGSTIDAGWLPANGATIGNPSSNATARADADTLNLFTYLWNNDASLAVSNGRGVTATQDFQNSKTIALPDYRGRTWVGVDQMGAPSTAGVLTAASTATPNQVGATFGAETETLSVAQLPAVTPTVTIGGSGQHTHQAECDTQGSHTHATTENPHTHTAAFNAQDVGVQCPNTGSTPVPDEGQTSHTTSGSTTGLTINAAGAHSHNVQVDSGNPGGPHSHTATCSSFGSGNAHPNVQPSILGYVHIKL